MLTNSMIVAHCHHQSYLGAGDFDLKVEEWCYGESETWA
jgi:hypothetical protein